MNKICLLNEFEKNIIYKNNIDNILIDKSSSSNKSTNMFEDYSSEEDED